MLIGVAGCASSAPWNQWGGPERNFMIEAKGLADTWPDEGPEKIWRRELGESAKRLEEHLEAMVKKYDAPVQCVAHSMGCMLLLAVMHRRPELIHSAIFAVTFAQSHDSAFTR